METTKRALIKPKPVRRPAQHELLRVVRGTEKRIDSLVLRYATGKMTAKEFTAGMETLLENRHARAATLGRNRAGDYLPQTIDDRLYARLVMEGFPGDAGQSHYLQGFLSDLYAGRYTDEEGNPKVNQIRQRSQSYTGRLTGTANELFVLASVLHSFDWKMGGAEHCEDCPRLTANSPYTWDRLPTVPRANSTQCKYNCRCYLVRSDGVTGFRAVESE